MRTYVQGADLPDLAIAWYDSDGDIINFATGWSFSVRVGKSGRPAIFEKTDGIAGDDAAPNVVISWDDGELDSLEPGIWSVEITATRDDDDKERKMATTISVLHAVGAVATP